MRLETGRFVGECRLMVTPLEQELLLQQVRSGEEPELPDDVRQHLIDHGHHGDTSSFPFEMRSTFLGLQVFVE